MKGRVMKLKDVISVIDVERTIVFVPEKEIEKVPEFKQHVDEAVDESIFISHGPGDYSNHLMMILDTYANNSSFEPFELFKFKDDLDTVMNMEVEKMDSYMADYDLDMLRIVVK